jgi:hypothetical protein
MLFFKKYGSRMHSDTKFGRRGRGVSYIDARQEKVLECHSDLHPSEKDLPEWRSGMFHKKIPPYVSKVM